MTIRILSALTFALALSASRPAHAASTADVVGFEQTRMADGTEVGIWYPAHGRTVHQRLGLSEQDTVLGGTPAGADLPLVVMSHGSGGSFTGHLDTAAALAQAGFVVAALTHPGDNWRDQSRATRVEDRPAALEALIGYMLGAWPSHRIIDPARVGAFGFSAGGFTVLAAAGGRPNLARMARHCTDHPGFYDCMLLAAHPRESESGRWPEMRDTRIKAIVVAAPALGFTFDRAGLQAVTIPVQLWRAGDDHILPAPDYADAVRAALPRAPEFHDIAGAGHFDFLAPCAADELTLPICGSAPGFDRIDFHRHFDAEVVAFFRQALH